MKTEICRDPYHSWLVFSEGIPVDRDSYQVHMITENDIPCLLHCRIRETDQQISYWYDITGMTPLKNMLDISGADRKLMERLLADLSSVFAGINEYLLDQNHLGLQTDWIFMDREERRFCFVYCPSLDADFSDSCRSFGESLLPKLDHRDRQAVVLGYSFYQRCVDGFGDLRSFPDLKDTPPALTADEAAAVKAEKELSPDLFFENEKKNAKSGTRLGLFRRLAEWRKQRALRRKERAEKRRQDKAERKRLQAEKKQLQAEKIQLQSEKKRLQDKAERELQPIQKAGTREAAAGEARGLLSAWEGSSEDFLSDIPNHRTFFEAGAAAVRKDTAGAGAAAVRKGTAGAGAAALRKDAVEAGTSMRSKEAASIDGNAETVCLKEPIVLPELRRERARLVPIAAAGEASGRIAEYGGTAIPLFQDSYVVGKNTAAAQIVLQSAAVSRVHARLLWDGVSYRLADLNSRNGTGINGVRIGDEELQPLEDGDRLTFADLEFTYLSRQG